MGQAADILVLCFAPIGEVGFADHPKFDVHDSECCWFSVVGEGTIGER